MIGNCKENVSQLNQIIISAKYYLIFMLCFYCSIKMYPKLSVSICIYISKFFIIKWLFESGGGYLDTKSTRVCTPKKLKMTPGCRIFDSPVTWRPIPMVCLQIVIGEKSALLQVIEKVTGFRKKNKEKLNS